MNTSTHSRHELSALDAIFLFFESDTAPMHIGALGIYDGNISAARYRRFLEARLHCLPRYRQRIRQAPLNIGHATWEEVTDFDIAHHVHAVRLPQPATPAGLREIAEQLYSPRLDLSRPPWKVYIIGPVKGGKTAILFCIHHALADGMSAVNLLQAMHDDSTPGPVHSQAHAQARPPKGELERVVAGISNELLAPLRAVRGLGDELVRVLAGLADGDPLQNIAEIARALQRFATPAPPFPFDTHHLSGRKKAAWSNYSLDELRACAKANKASINDVVLCIVGGGLRRYLQERGDLAGHRELLVTVPVNVRAPTHTGHLGNEISLQPVSVPLGAMQEQRRLRRIARATRALKEAHVADSVHLVLHALLSVPTSVLFQVGRTHQLEFAQSLLSRVTTFPTLNTICTNVPGPPHPIYVLGKQCIAMHPMAPVIPGMGLIFPCVSYNGKLFLSAIADQAAISDLQRLKRCLDQASRELLRAECYST